MDRSKRHVYGAALLAAFVFSVVFAYYLLTCYAFGRYSVAAGRIFSEGLSFLYRLPLRFKRRALMSGAIGLGSSLIFVLLSWKMPKRCGRVPLRRILLTLFYIALLLLFLRQGRGGLKGLVPYLRNSREITALREHIKADGRILHAAGAVETAEGYLQPYTNSKEAIEQALACGERIIEIDVRATDDLELLCTHSGNFLLDENGQVFEERNVTLEQFLHAKTLGGFTPITFDQLAEYVRAYPDLYIVLDAKRLRTKTYRKIAKTYPDIMDQLIPQIYHRKSYDTLWKMGYRNIIYTLYHADPEEYSSKALKTFLDNRLLLAITFPRRFLDDGSWETLKTAKVPLYTHTVDIPEEIQAMYALDIDAVYTNLIEGQSASLLVTE